MTRYPTGAWVTQQARHLLTELDEHIEAFRFLIRDRDAKSTPTLDAAFTAAGIEIPDTAAAAPGEPDRKASGGQHPPGVHRQDPDPQQTPPARRARRLSKARPRTPPAPGPSPRRRRILGGLIEYERAA